MGSVLVTSSPVQNLPPITLIDKGHVIKIKSRSFVSSLPIDIAHRMSREAKKIIESYLSQFPHEVEYDFEIVQETRESSYGAGTGIM